MENANTKYCLVILSNYKYEDLWPISTHYLINNWPEIYNSAYIVTDNYDKTHHNGIKVISVSSNSFSQRLYLALKQIDAKFVVLILDDYFLTKKIDNSKIKEIVLLMHKNDIDYVRLFKIPKQRTKSYMINTELYKVDLNVNYSINLQPGIWNRDSLLEISKEEMNPWEFEVSLRLKSFEKNYNCYATLGKEFPFDHGLLRGKFFRKTYKMVMKDGLLQTQRAKLTFFEEFKYKSKVVISHLTPKRVKSLVKRFLKKCGFKFYTD